MIKPKIYLAAPFFTKEQIAHITLVEKFCETHNIPVLSPRKFTLPPKAPMADRARIFEQNLEWIAKAYLVLACIDDVDAGTYWEMGYAFSEGIPVVTYTTRHNMINLMLAASCKGFLRSFLDISRFLKGKEIHHGGYQGVDVGPDWDFDWEVAEKWRDNIY